MSRIFLAVPLSDAVRGEVLKVKAANAGVPRLVWMREHNLHLTVYFIGQVPRDNVQLIFERVKPVIAAQASFDLLFRDICLAPPASENRRAKFRMIWARFHRHEDFRSLAHALHDSIKDLLAGNPFHFEDPLPHITLARFNSTFKTEQLSLPSIALKEMRIDEVELWESVPAEGGVKYVSVDKVKLSG
ncbi:MAG TPA: RNA 2',3'-cyclic phosphodiesterase [Bacteroidia bacterium]